jgi:uncharacterized protein YerC
MPHVSRIKLSKKTETHLMKTLQLVLANLTSQDQISLFLLSLLTPTEQLMLVKRLGIVILLREGLPDSQIAQTLHVTRITVSRLRYFDEARGQGYDLAFKIIQNEKILQDLKGVLFKLAGYSIRAAGGRVNPGVF